MTAAAAVDALVGGVAAGREEESRPYCWLFCPAAGACTLPCPLGCWEVIRPYWGDVAARALAVWSDAEVRVTMPRLLCPAVPDIFAGVGA